MILVLRKNIGYIVSILAIAAIALAVAAYIVGQQGARIPFFSEKPVRITAILDTAQSITPGQGQTVQVAGVEIGKIANVELEEARAKLLLDIKPKWIKDGLIKTDATALLRPRTPLKDMYLQVFPGKRSGQAIKAGFQLPLRNTLTDVNLDQILAQLDGRTRDYLDLLLNGTGKGLKFRGGDLAEVFRRFGPTFGDLRRVNGSVAKERVALRRVVTSLAGLNTKLAEKPKDLSQLVTAANGTFGAFASEDANLRDAVAELPATLKRATETLQEVRPLANELGPATKALTPAIQALDRANKTVRPAARTLTPIVRTQVRPFVRASRPLVRDLVPAAQNLNALAPDATADVHVINRFFNLAAYNKNGREGPDVAGRDEGYLFWLAWATHQGANLINVDDANGPMRPIFLTGTCTTLKSLVTNQPELEFAMGISPLLATICGDPATTSTNLTKVDGLIKQAAAARAAAAKATAPTTAKAAG